MATETLYATSLTSGSVSGSSNALGAPDGTYTTDSGNTSWTARFAMGNPSSDLASGTQTVTIRVRKVGSNDPTVNSIAVYDGGTLLSTSSVNTSVTSTSSQDVQATFAASVFNSASSLANIEIEVNTSGVGGSPSARGPVQLDGITWSGDIILANRAGSTSGGFDFAGAAVGAAPHYYAGTASGAFVFDGTTSGTYPVYSPWTSIVTGTTASSTPNAGSASGSYDFTGGSTGETPPNAGSASGSFDFTGSATGATDLSGTSTGSYAFSGTATGSRSPEGSASGGFDYAGSSVGQSIHEGPATGSVAWAGSSSGNRQPEGVASGSYDETGTTASGSSPSGGSAAGAYDLTGSAAGEVPPNAGSTTGGYDFAGSANGTSPVVGQKYGSTSGSYAFTGAITGARSSLGTSTGSVAWVGSAVGETPANAGTASGSFNFAGTALGQHLANGAASGTLTWTGASTGDFEPLGSASGSADWTGSATGVQPSSEGEAIASYSYDGSATGYQPAGDGTASSTTGWFGFAHGVAPAVPDHEGTASGSFVLTIEDATGENNRSAISLGWFTFKGTAVGEGVDPTYRFEPPTYRIFKDPPLLVPGMRIPMQASVCVVRVGGTLTQIKDPTGDQLKDAGEEGADWFLGGHIYEVPMTVGQELQAAGYDVTEI